MCTVGKDGSTASKIGFDNVTMLYKDCDYALQQWQLLDFPGASPVCNNLLLPPANEVAGR